MYNVGQIIYIYKKSNESLFPCVVAEQTIKKTLKGEEINYTILLPDQEGTLVDLSRLDVKCFESIHHFKEFYIKESTSKADSSMRQCETIEKERFASFIDRENKKPEVLKKDDSIEKNKKKETITIQDEDNVKINVDLSKLTEMGL
jgi:hypothetical protein